MSSGKRLRIVILLNLMPLPRSNSLNPGGIGRLPLWFFRASLTDLNTPHRCRMWNIDHDDGNRTRFSLPTTGPKKSARSESGKSSWMKSHSLLFTVPGLPGAVVDGSMVPTIQIPISCTLRSCPGLSASGLHKPRNTRHYHFGNYTPGL